MNNQFNEPTGSRVQSATRGAMLRKLRHLGMALAVAFALPIGAQEPNSVTSTVTDAAGDAIFPFRLYDGPVPPWIDVVKASVTLTQGVFHFEIKVSTAIPSNGDPGLNPSVNHLGSTFGIETDRKTAEHFNFHGHPGNYYFNFLIGALYVIGDSGVGLDPGWRGFMLGPDGVSEIPLVIRGDTYVFETSAASLGSPASFDWAVLSECDPVPVTEEKNKSLLIVDYAPDRGYASWPPSQP